MRLYPILLTILLALPSPLIAQEPDPVPSPAETCDHASLLDDAIHAAPPQRSSFGKKIAQDDQALHDLDKWIEQIGIDDPKSLVVKDLLMVMPPQIAGPRIVSLAKKSQDPAIQENWAKWLKKYPDAYASVLLEWLKQSNTKPDHFLSLLRDYGQVAPDNAMHIWIQLIQNHPISDLQKITAYGLNSPKCTAQLAEAALKTDDEIHMLRLYRGLIHCTNQSQIEIHDLDEHKNNIDSLLSSSTISRRIVAMDLIGSNKFGIDFSQSYIPVLEKAYSERKNSTERASALKALDNLNAPQQSQHLTDAITNGDDNLRSAAASILLKYDTPPVELDLLKVAFNTENWPDTQQDIYTSLVKAMTDDTMRLSFQKTIVMDNTRPLQMREFALDNIFQTDSQFFVLTDMAKLQKDEAPLELIASAAEHLYASQSAARPTLRKWIIAQQPFERRILSTFAFIVRTDEMNHDPNSLETMRTICSKAYEQQNILTPCLNYMSSHAQTEDDNKLLQNLQKRHDQIETMSGFEF